MNLTDPDIFKKIKNGDLTAFSSLFDKTYTHLCFFANKYISDLDKSRSIVQQIFVDLWVKREKIKIHSSPKSYLYNTVKNRCIDYLRKENKIILGTESQENTKSVPFQDLVEEAELNDRINLAINQLPEKCREIFTLCRFDGLKYAEIAEKLNISVKTVEMQMGIALKKLRKNLSDYQSLILISLFLSKKN
ncbi:RNA polymerase sigma-70 factor [Maribellus comscasis]|uniref:RNA polymerase sigma-70 factor n=1 Tax=Maribellus comscasis TaxID=2681766 RepID=A0A6I6K0R1_9BACT|nr:RNA polymerase sigma-70 factor [Maribellus comscasis]QGY43484.1 RNA polymerase sigma-70 factor [Maribellus comscasis]